MAERLAIRLSSFGMPQNVERVYATKIGVPGTLKVATLANFAEAAKKVVHEESGLAEIELAAETEGPSGGVKISGSEAKKSLININRVEDVMEY